MSALEQEIIEKYRLLDKEAQQRVRHQMDEEVTIKPDDTEEREPQTILEWLEAATKLGDEMTAKYGKLDISIADLIRESREERLNDILDRP